ncbi:MAG: hypothetical protein H6506_02085 [Calditrichaeota bacterium]|nr:hypothetical protein [Calditrichota bacterium]MCB9391422.1 hypothetical protein [Calditrichota bacterium]
MKARILLLAAVLGLVILSTGCYTKLYRPGMEDMGPFSQSTLYNRYDSTAIDTTLTKPETVDVYPNNYNDYYGWSSWGRPRGYTRWGFDFDRFSPNYYWSYYGYYDYYGRPWWQDWNRYNNPWWYYGGGSGEPGEPPSQRPGRRSSDTGVPPAVIGNGGYASPPVYVNPAPAPAQPDPNTQKSPPAEDNSQKRNGKRRR